MRARSAVSWPSASQPTVRSMRIGWRFGWMRSDSSRDSVHFTGASQEEGGERGLRLVRHVLLAAERAAVRHQLDGDLRRGSMPSTDAIWSRSSHTPWPPEYIVKRPSAFGHDERRLRLEERVLDALGLEHLVHDVRAGRERGVDVAARVRRARQHVAVELPHRVVVVVERGDRDR